MNSAFAVGDGPSLLRAAESFHKLARQRQRSRVPSPLPAQSPDQVTLPFGWDFPVVHFGGLDRRMTEVLAERLVILDELQAKISASSEWDLVICDEAHRMSASYFSGEVKETRRYKLGMLLGSRTRNLLLMSATPHNGKEADFQRFMGLLDADRFEGRFREGSEKPRREGQADA